MAISLKDFTDRGDRYEATWNAANSSVTVSIDKAEVDADTDTRLQAIHASLQAIVEASQRYFEIKKSEYGLGYVDDLADPQVIVERQAFGVYWWSDKGEANCECVIGVDFSFSDLAPYDLTIGD